jgi:hypothetical protein
MTKEAAARAASRGDSSRWVATPGRACSGSWPARRADRERRPGGCSVGSCLDPSRDLPADDPSADGCPGTRVNDVPGLTVVSEGGFEPHARRRALGSQGS